MKDLQDILQLWQTQRNRPLVLATLVQAQGSTYRRAGARLLIAEDGQIAGSISGGCLENDVIERAQTVFQTGQPCLVTYDSRTDADLIFGMGLGCNGLVRVFIERLLPDEPANPLAFIARQHSRRQMGALATVLRVEGEAGVIAGEHIQWPGTEETAPNEFPFAPMQTDLQQTAQEGTSRLQEYALPSGPMEVFLETVTPPTPLVIFGAGQDAIPLARLAKELGWHVSVVDARPAFATPERFPGVDALLAIRPECLANQLPLDSHMAAVIMTHNYLHDRDLLETLLPSPVRYVGILGPKRRTERLLDELRAEGQTWTPAQMQRLHSPIGLDIGADNPAEIALSILAEIQAVLAHRSSGFLRERKGPIYTPPAEDNLASTLFADLPGETPLCPLSVS